MQITDIQTLSRRCISSSGSPGGWVYASKKKIFNTRKKTWHLLSLTKEGGGWYCASITAGFESDGGTGPLGFCFCLAFTSCFDGGGAILTG